MSFDSTSHLQANNINHINITSDTKGFDKTKDLSMLDIISKIENHQIIFQQKLDALDQRITNAHQKQTQFYQDIECKLLNLEKTLAKYEQEENEDIEQFRRTIHCQMDRIKNIQDELKVV